MLTLYTNIKKIRKELHMTQDELAKRTGYTNRSSIAKIEQGSVDLSQTKIQLFAEALGVTSSELMGDDHLVPSNAEFHAAILKDANLLEIIRKYTLLPEDKKVLVENLIDGLSE